MADNKKMSVEEILAACRRADTPGGATESGAGDTSSPAKQTPAQQAAAQQAPAGGEPAETPASATPAARTTPAGAGKPAGAMSTADILAAARAGKPGGSSDAKPAASSATGDSAGQPPSAGKTPSAGKATAPGAAKAPGTSKPPGTLSTADILAAARAGKPGAASAGGAAKSESAAGKSAAGESAAGKPAAAKSSAATPAAKPPAGKSAAEKPAAAATSAASTSAASTSGAGSAGPKDTASILAAVRAAKLGPVSKAEAAARDRQLESTAVKGKKKEVPPLPEKPAYAQPRAQAVATGDDRRGFMTGIIAAFSGSALAVGFSSLAVTFNLWTLGLARFMFPNILIEPPTRFKVGFPDELAPGQVQTKFVPQFGVWIVRYEYDGLPQIYALQTVCTHLGCTPNWLEGEQKFKCPCHGSGFYKDGINFEGPAPRPLERFAIRLADDGQLEVDKSRKFKEEMGQWRDGSSFVSV